jgi:predicted nucleotidyltransferase
MAKYQPFKLRYQRQKERFFRLQKQVQKAIDYLYQQGAEQVYIFGSFLKPERFDEHSDIDLAVKGIDNLHTRLKIEARLMQIFQDADFDLVWLDDETEIKPHVLRAIKKEGKLCLRIR